MHPKTSQDHSDERPPETEDGAESPGVSIAHVFFIVLTLHVFAVGGVLYYHARTDPCAWRRFCDNVAARLGYVRPSAVAPSNGTPVLEALAARLSQIDARIDRIEEELAPRAPKRRPPTRLDHPNDKPAAEPSDPNLLPLAHPERPPPHADAPRT